MTLRAMALLGLLLLAAPGCGAPRMREARPDEAITAPPAGKALVNFQRPSDYGGHREYAIFDRTTLLGTNFGEQRFQYVCDPGEHVFIGYLTDSIWATVSVIKATLLPDKVYDCIVDAGYFTSSIALNPLKKDEERREELPDWEDDSDLMVKNEAGNAAFYEADRRADNEEILKDFLEGEKTDRVKILAPDDCR